VPADRVIVQLRHPLPRNGQQKFVADSGRSGDDGQVEGARGTLFGRASELRDLRAAIERDHSTAVIGEAGIGKTTLVRAAAELEGRTLREGGGLGTLRSTPYLALRRALGTGLDGDPVAAAATVERLVGPDILFVDDLQWVDDASLAVLEILAGRLLVVTTIRSDDPGAAPARATIARSGFGSVEVGPLGDDAASELVLAREPDLDRAAVAELVRVAAGNPLVLDELIASGGPSAATTRALGARVARLHPAARQIVELLSILERPHARSALNPAAAMEAIEAGLVVVRDGQAQVRHALVAEAVRAGLAPEARRRLHRTAADAVGDPGEQARHLAAAGDTMAAAELANHALAEATDPRERAALLEVAADVAEPDARPALRLEAARILDELSEWTGVIRLLADESDGGSADERVELEALLAHARFALGDHDASRALLGAAAQRIVPLDGAAAARRAVETATFLVNVDGQVGPAIAALDTALEHQPAGSVAARDLDALRRSILLLAAGSGSLEPIQEAFAEAFGDGRYRTATDRARVIQYALLMGASSEAGLAFLLDVTARYEAAGAGSVAPEFRADASLAALLAGHLEQAVSIADELLERPSSPRARQSAEIARGRALVHLGRFDQAEADLARIEPSVSPDWFGRGELLTAQAELAYWSGRPEIALRLVESALAVPPPLPDAHAPPNLLRAVIHAEIGDDPGPLPAGSAPSLAGASPEVEGLQRGRAGDHDAAAAAFDRAAESWAPFHVPRALICRWSAAEALRRAGRTEAAVERLTSVLDAATAIGFEALAARIRRSLRQAGVRATSPSAARSATLAGGLTTRERELVALVERGLTNIEIARRLGLGRPTVARILSSAMGKLGVESRAQLAARVDA
jgi:DNA-binding CsgD family transcriptional regulator/tetratricopeptide (TPR) repeat protein